MLYVQVWFVKLNIFLILIYFSDIDFKKEAHQSNNYENKLTDSIFHITQNKHTSTKQIYSR